MPTEFVGTALPLDEAGVNEVVGRMGIHAPELWAVLNVETRGCGFLPDKRPAILYERHIFSKETNHKFDSAHPDISNRNQGGYGGDGAHQYDRLAKAIALDRKAALDAVSWGIGQLMGFNSEIAVYPDVETMVKAMMESENDQLRGMTGEIVHNGLHRALRDHRWRDFARGYNGPKYAENQYDTRLAAAYQKYANGGLPDLTVRTAQVYLTYLGLNPGPVDGQAGRRTFSALNEFQHQNGLPVNNTIDESIVARLKEKAIGS